MQSALQRYAHTGHGTIYKYRIQKSYVTKWVVFVGQLEANKNIAGKEKLRECMCV